MRRFLLLFIVSFLAPALSACTGTSEEGNPVLLVTGFREGAAGRVALIESTFGTSASEEGSLNFLEASVRPLEAPAVSYDIVDRGGTRNTLVALSRGAVAAGNSTSYLTSFSLRSLDPDNPANFRQTRPLQVISRDTVTLPNTLPNPQFCPSSVQVTQTGAYAAVLNEPGLCRFGGQPSIDIFNLQTEPIRLLQRINRVAAGGFYLSQSPAQDLLYYATNESRSLRLQRATLPRPGETFGPGDTVTVETVADVTSTIGNDFVDLGLSGLPGEERLVVLFEESLVNVTNFTGDGTASEAIVTPPNNARVVRDDQRDTEATLILGTPEARRFSYVPTSTSGERELEVESANVIAVDAVIEPTNGFVYFLRGGQENQISLFDLNSYDSGNTLPDPTPVDLLPPTDLVNPSFITWAQSVPAPATP